MSEKILKQLFFFHAGGGAMNLIQQIEREMLEERTRTDVDVRPGDTVRVHVRIRELLREVTAMREFQSGLASDDELVANYELPAHGGRWAGDGRSFGGRGQSQRRAA